MVLFVQGEMDNNKREPQGINLHIFAEDGCKLADIGCHSSTYMLIGIDHQIFNARQYLVHDCHLVDHFTEG